MTNQDESNLFHYAEMKVNNTDDPYQHGMMGCFTEEDNPTNKQLLERAGIEYAYDYKYDMSLANEIQPVKLFVYDSHYNLLTSGIVNIELEVVCEAEETED